MFAWNHFVAFVGRILYSCGSYSNVTSVMQRLDSPIHWIEIDPLDSVIQPLNTRSGICHAFEM